MAEVDAQAYAVTTGNAAAGASNSVETQQPGGSGALRQVTVNGDAVTRANMQTIKAASTAAVAADMAAVVAISPNNTVAVTESGTWTVQPGNTQNTTNWLVAPGADVNAKSTTSYWNSAQLATVTAMKASAGKLYALNIYNPNSTIAYLQMFDLATGSVTLGTTTPKKSFPIPGLGYMDTQWPVPIGFATAISHAATTTSTGLTALGTGLVINGEYI